MGYPNLTWTIPHRHHVRRVQSMARVLTARGDSYRARALLLTVDPGEFVDVDRGSRALGVLRDARSSEDAVLDAIRSLLDLPPAAHVVR
jgi:hypothetical protein